MLWDLYGRWLIDDKECRHSNGYGTWALRTGSVLIIMFASVFSLSCILSLLFWCYNICSLPWTQIYNNWKWTRCKRVISLGIIVIKSYPCAGCRGSHISYTISGPLPPGRFLVLISIRGLVDPNAVVRLEGLGQLKNPVTSSGIEPATFRLVT
jgi:hypothetical protein